MILALNTSTVQFSLALVEEDGVLVAESCIAPGARNFRSFMPLLSSRLTPCFLPKALALEGPVLILGRRHRTVTAVLRVLVFGQLLFQIFILSSERFIFLFKVFQFLYSCF